jgi:hypothetical protein
LKRALVGSDEIPQELDLPIMQILSVIFDFDKWSSEGITAVATAVIAIFTVVLVRVTNRQAKLTKEALIADKQAFVFASGIFGFWEPNKATGNYDWRIRPIWQNAGDTPTRKMRLYVDCELRNAPLPSGFSFTQITTPPGTGLLGPKSTSMGGAAPLAPRAAITPQDILDVQNGTKFLYLWGWAKYFDVFPGTLSTLPAFAGKSSPQVILSNSLRDSFPICPAL